jgi:hypothetical protein
MNLFHCLANGIFGAFGDYIWAATRSEAERKFQAAHGVWPSSIRIERRAA